MGVLTVPHKNESSDPGTFLPDHDPRTIRVKGEDGTETPTILKYPSFLSASSSLIRQSTSSSASTASLVKDVNER